MNAGFIVLALVGIGLIAIGSLAMFRLKSEGDHELEFLGAKIKTPTAGLAVILLGVVAIVPTARELATGPGLKLRDISLSQGGTYNVRCPVSIQTEAAINAVGSGSLSYRFLRRRDTHSPMERTDIRTVYFDDSGTARFEDEFVIAIPQGRVTAEVRLEVVAPEDRVSDSVFHDVTCDPILPPGPDSLPPDIAPPGQ